MTPILDRCIDRYFIDPGNPPKTLAENEDYKQDYRAAALQ